MNSNGYQGSLAWIVSRFFDKKSFTTHKGTTINSVVISDTQQLAKELQKKVIRKFEKRKVYSSLKDNIWGASKSDMQFKSNVNNGFRFLFYIKDIYSKYACVVPLKEKKGKYLLYW